MKTKFYEKYKKPSWWDDLNGLLLFATKQDALLELKTAIKASGEHKQRVIIHIAVDGLKIRDEKTGVKRTVFLFPFIMILILTFYPILKAERLKWKNHNIFIFRVILSKNGFIYLLRKLGQYFFAKEVKNVSNSFDIRRMDCLNLQQDLQTSGKFAHSKSAN